MEKKTPQDELDTIYNRLEDGNISVGEAIRDSTKLTSEIAKTQVLDEAGRRTQEIFTNRDVQAAETQWHKDYPDYNEFVESGQAKDYMKKNPMLIDETIAFFQHKADQEGETIKTETEITEPKAPAGADADEKYLDQDEIQVEQMKTILNMRDKRPRRQEEPITLSEIENQQMTTLQKMRGKGE